MSEKDKEFPDWKSAATQRVHLSTGARAITSCDGVFVPGTSQQGRGLMAHELSHVVQSRGGEPMTMQLKGVKTDAATKAEMAATSGKTIRLEIGGAGGKACVVEGRLKTVVPTEASAEWSIVFETIQRVR